MNEPNLCGDCFKLPELQENIHVKDDEPDVSKFIVFCKNCRITTHKHLAKEDCLAEWHKNNTISSKDATILTSLIDRAQQQDSKSCKECHTSKPIDSYTVTTSCNICKAQHNEEKLTTEELERVPELIYYLCISHEDDCSILKAIPHLKADD